MQENKSEVAQLLKRIDMEHSAAQQGLAGLAVMANHEAINARMEVGAERILQLAAQGRHEEASRLMDAPNWCVEGEEELSTDQKAAKPAEKDAKDDRTAGTV